MLKKFIGDRAFYNRVLAVALPIVIQSAITNFVSLLDNVMVGQIGTIPMSGVSIVNQLIFVFNLCIFGASAGAGIFSAQFYGSNDHQGVRYTFRFKVLACLALVLIGLGVFTAFGEELIQLYLTGEGDPADAAQALSFGKQYLTIMLIGLFPFAMSNAYSSTLRETGQTVVPMVAGICAVFVNLVFNYILIFGKFGAPAMGVRGAALATVLSRFVELAIVALWTHCNSSRQIFIQGVYRSFYIPGKLLGRIAAKGLPLLINETLWSIGMVTLNQCYSTCGLDVVPAVNISSTIYNLAGVGYMAMGNAVGIIMGQMLGARSTEAEVRDYNRKLAFAACLVGLVFGGAMAGISGVFPMLYKTSDSVRHLASQLICISAIMMPFNAYTNSAYFTLRSGGQTLATFLFDSCFVWVVCVPLAFCLSRFTAITILPLFALCHAAELIKCMVGGYLLRKGVWIQNLTQS